MIVFLWHVICHLNVTDESLCYELMNNSTKIWPLQFLRWNRLSIFPFSSLHQLVEITQITGDLFNLDGNSFFSDLWTKTSRERSEIATVSLVLSNDRDMFRWVNLRPNLELNNIVSSDL